MSLVTRQRQSFIHKRKNLLTRIRPKEELIVQKILYKFKQANPLMKIIPQASRLIRKYGLFYFDFCVKYKFNCMQYFIEIDGPYHQTNKQIERDKLKEQALTCKANSKLLRISNDECSDISTLTIKLADYLQII